MSLVVNPSGGFLEVQADEVLITRYQDCVALCRLMLEVEKIQDKTDD